MTPHVTESRRAEVQPLAPILRMIHIFEEWTGCRHAQPLIPVETIRYRIGRRGQLLRIAPLLFTPRVDLFYFPDRSALDQLHRRLIRTRGMNLNPHLGG